MHSVGVRFQADWPLQNPNGHIIEKIYLGQDAAKSSKLAPGDVVTHVDGAETKTWSPDILRRALQGVAGTKVAITFLPQGGKEPDSVQLRRGSSSYWQTGEERDALRQLLESLTERKMFTSPGFTRSCETCKTHFSKAYEMPLGGRGLVQSTPVLLSSLLFRFILIRLA